MTCSLGKETIASHPRARAESARAGGQEEELPSPAFEKSTDADRNNNRCQRWHSPGIHPCVSIRSGPPRETALQFAGSTRKAAARPPRYGASAGAAAPVPTRRLRLGFASADITAST